ncbi:alpha/beta hydrolase [Prosthecobacter sp.]|uniref:alpha/beta hydrolase n=1 Tax=Prosthecobacter sp. TaxID=1965333 RepID=UPI001D9A9BF3|nr:alpha/beta hydrolase [Prosthecobacter sp.]MCB1278483.1 alpha/beta hydrolase [Prosthecobacter sp.]
MKAVYFIFLTALPLAAADPIELKLWPDGAPGQMQPHSKATDEFLRTKAGKSTITDITDPTITVYRPEKPNGTSVIVAPGGAYVFLSAVHEGTQVCEWLNTIGVTGILLKYRTPTRDETAPHEKPVQDAARAILLVRKHSEEWGLNPARVGLLGFSAGGNLLAHLACDRDWLSEPAKATDIKFSLPTFGIMIYGGGFVDFKEPTKFKEGFSVPADAPPMFIACAHDDGQNPIASAMLYLEYKKRGIPCELHLFTKGGHGFGMRKAGNPINDWPQRCTEWMAEMGWLPTIERLNEAIAQRKAQFDRYVGSKAKLTEQDKNLLANLKREQLELEAERELLLQGQSKDRAH